MKKILLILLIFIICKSQLWAQHYLTLGVGFSGMSLNSKDLDKFKETYNLVNGSNLALLMDGMGIVLGLRGEIAYRYLGKFGGSVSVGYQGYKGQDGVRYNNGETRNLTFKMNSMYLGCEYGITRNTFFVNGLVTTFFNRKILIDCVYSGPPEEVSRKTLNGNYSSDNSFSTDIGIVVGILRNPIILTAKITYPLYTGGKSNVLQDKNKVAANKDVFPDDYVAYTYGEHYDGVACNIDGLKIMLTFIYAIQL